MTEMARHRLGVLLVAGAALWWSSGGIFIRSVHTDPWTTIFWRSASAAATLFLFMAIRKRGAVFCALAVVVTRHSRNIQMLPAAFLATVFAMFLSFGVLAVGHSLPWPVAPLDFAWLTGFGALQMAVGMVMFTYGVRLIPAAEGALLSVIETVSAPVWVFFFFNEDPGIRAIVGGYIVLAAVTIYAALDLRRPAAA